MDADLVEARDDGVNAVVEFFNGFVINVTVDAGDKVAFALTHGFEEVFGLLNGAFHIGGAVVWDDDEEGLVHNVGFFGEDADELEVVVHENAEQHIVVVTTHFGEALNVGADVDFLGADEDLDGEVEGVEEVLVTVFYAFALGFGHKVKVDGLAGDDGAEGAVFHDDETVAKLGEKEGGLGGKRVFNDGCEVRGGSSGGGRDGLLGWGSLGGDGLRLGGWLGSGLGGKGLSGLSLSES